MAGSYSPVGSFVANAKATKRRPDQAEITALQQSLNQSGNYDSNELSYGMRELDRFFTNLEQSGAEQQFQTDLRAQPKDYSRQTFDREFSGLLANVRQDQRDNAFRTFLSNQDAGAYLQGLQPSTVQAQQVQRQAGVDQRQADAQRQIEQRQLQQPQQPVQQASVPAPVQQPAAQPVASQQAPTQPFQAPPVAPVQQAPVAAQVQAVSVEPAAAPAPNVGPLTAAGQPSVDLRAQQDELVRQLIDKSETAGRDAVGAMSLPAYQAPQIPTEFSTQAAASRAKTPLETALESRLTGSMAYEDSLNPLEADLAGRLSTSMGYQRPTSPLDKPITDSLTRGMAYQREVDPLEATLDKNLTGSMAYQREVSPLETLLQQYYQDSVSADPANDPVTKARLGEYELKRKQEAEALRDELNRMGMTQQGDSIDVLGDFYLGQENQRQGILAEGSTRQAAQAQAAQGLLGTTIGAGQGDESLRQNAMALAQSLVGSRDSSRQNTESLRQNATRSAQDYAGAQTGTAQSDEALRQDAMSLAQQLIGTQANIRQGGESLRQNAAALTQNYTGANADRELEEGTRVGNIRGTQTLAAQTAGAQAKLDLGRLTEDARQYEGDLGLRKLGMQQDVSDRTLNRLLTQTDPTGERIFQEGIRGSLIGEGQDERRLLQEILDSNRQSITDKADLKLRQTSSEREGRLTDQQILDMIQGRSIAQTDSGIRQNLSNQDILNAIQGRQLASTSSEREGQMLIQQIADMVQGRQLNLRADTREEADLGLRRQDAGDRSALTAQQIADSVLGRQVDTADLRLRQNADNRAKDLTGQEIADRVQGRQLDMRADTREEADLGIRRQDAGNRSAITAQEIADAVLGRQQTGQNMRLNESADNRANLTLDQLIADAVQGRQIAGADLGLRRNADSRAGAALEQDIANASLGRQQTTQNMRLNEGANNRANQTLEQMIADAVLGRQQTTQEMRIASGDADIRRNSAAQADMTSSQNRSIDLADSRRRGDAATDQRAMDAETLSSLVQGRTQNSTLFNERVSDRDQFDAANFGTVGDRQTLTGQNFTQQQLRDAISTAILSEGAGLGTGGVSVSNALQQLFNRLGVKTPGDTPDSDEDVLLNDALEETATTRTETPSGNPTFSTTALGEGNTREDAIAKANALVQQEGMRGIRIGNVNGRLRMYDNQGGTVAAWDPATGTWRKRGS